MERDCTSEWHQVLEALPRGSTDWDEPCSSLAWVSELCRAGQWGDEEVKLVRCLLWGKAAWHLTRSAGLFQPVSCGGTRSPSTPAGCDVVASVCPSPLNHGTFVVANEGKWRVDLKSQESQRKLWVSKLQQLPGPWMLRTGCQVNKNSTEDNLSPVHKSIPYFNLLAITRPNNLWTSINMRIISLYSLHSLTKFLNSIHSQYMFMPWNQTQVCKRVLLS